MAAAGAGTRGQPSQATRPARSWPVTIVGYVAVASVRTPPFEPVGLLIKVLQVAILVGVAWLLLARRRPVHA
jgi:hypothetical protein